MEIKVVRDLFSTLSTQGQLYLDGAEFCYTLEPPVKTDGSKPRAIDCGVFDLTIRWSNHFQRHVPHVENVPGFVAIEQHIGNYPRDTDACTLVGMQRGPQPNYIAQSLVAFTHLLQRYLAVATLTNPDEPNEKLHVWHVGKVTYENSTAQAPDVTGDIAV